MVERYKKLIELRLLTSKHSMYVECADREIELAGKYVMIERLFRKHATKALEYMQKSTAVQLKIDELQQWFLEKYNIL